MISVAIVRILRQASQSVCKSGRPDVFEALKTICIREAAKKVLLLMAGPLMPNPTPPPLELNGR